MERSTDKALGLLQLMRLVVTLPFLLWVGAATAGDTIEVCSSCAVTRISDAIARAPSGATIRVLGGVYREGPLVIDKRLELIGEGEPVLDGEGKHEILMISGDAGPDKVGRADGTVIRGFVLKDSGSSYLREIAAIKVEKARDCRIENNRILNSTYSLYLAEAKGCHIIGNTIVGSKKETEAESGNGIHIWNGADHLIERNNIKYHRDGIYFEFVKNSRIRHNVVTEGLRYGLHFMSSNDCEYTDNIFARSGAGVAVMYSKGITMVRNQFKENSGAAAYGLLLKDIYSSRIEENDFADNTVGIFMETSNRSVIRNNRVLRNGFGLRVMGSCEDNEFTRNDFIANTFDVSTNSTLNSNRFHENYWSAYDGYDLDRDGIGDKPFRPVSLSSIILERVDSSFILLRSFLFSLLDQVERALPELIPERLKDEKPLMKEARA